MKNDTRPTSPDASYINGKAYNGKYPERAAQQMRKNPAAKSAPRPASPANQRSANRTGADGARRSSESAIRRSSQQSASHHSSSHRSSHSSSRRKKRAIKKFFKDFAPTIIAVVGAVILVSVIVIISMRGNGEDETYDPGQSNVIDVPDYRSSGGILEFDEGDAKNSIVFPATSKYFEDGRPDVVLKHDEDGRLTGATYYLYLDNGSSAGEKEYDPNGMLVTEKLNTASEKGCVSTVVTVKRDKNNVYNGYVVDETDEAGVAKKQTEYTLTGVVDHYSYLEYGADGRLSKETVYSPYDMVTGYYEYLYDEAGNVSEKLQYDANYAPMGKTAWEYDAAGRVVKESFFIKDVCRSYNEYGYKEDGSYVMTSYTLIDEGTMTYEKKVYGG